VDIRDAFRSVHPLLLSSRIPAVLGVLDTTYLFDVVFRRLNQRNRDELEVFDLGTMPNYDGARDLCGMFVNDYAGATYEQLRPSFELPLGFPMSPEEVPIMYTVVDILNHM
jgi:hypothetical protein